MKKLIIFDCDCVIWTVFHGLKVKLSHDGKDTSIIYGFLNHVFSVQAYEKADYIAFAWDSKLSKRKELFPDYKKKRANAKKELSEEEKAALQSTYEQSNLLRTEILPKLGFSNIFHQDGYEGDDIIASLVESYIGKAYIKIVGRDGDLFQLLDKTVVMYDPMKGKLTTADSIREKYGIEPHQFKDVKAICGCPTDEVPGIVGVGETKAIQYIKGELKYTTKAYKQIESSPEVIALTRKLTSLPFEGTNKFTLSLDSCLVNRLKSVARTYGLKSFVTERRIEEYEQNFIRRGTPDKGEQTGNKENKGRMGAFGNDLSEF